MAVSVSHEGQRSFPWGPSFTTDINLCFIGAVRDRSIMIGTEKLS